MTQRASGGTSRGLGRARCRARALLVPTVAAGALALAGGAASSPGAPSRDARMTALSVVYSFTGQYTNTQQLGPAFCNVRLTETADYRGWLRYRHLELSLTGDGQARSGEQLRLLVGKWTVRGSYYPDEGCQGQPHEVECTGALRYSARGPHRGVVHVRVRGKTIFFSVVAGYAGIFESDTYALDPTIGSSSPAACLAPLSPYLGLRDVTPPLMNVAGQTPLLRLAKIRQGQKVVLPARPRATTTAVDVAHCSGTVGCKGRARHSEQLTIEVPVPPSNWSRQAEGRRSAPAPMSGREIQRRVD